MERFGSFWILLDDLGGGAGAVGVGGNNDVHTINGLLAHLAGKVVVSNVGNSLLTVDLINSSHVLVDINGNIGEHVVEGGQFAER